jgi:hypothetical protein
MIQNERKKQMDQSVYSESEKLSPFCYKNGFCAYVASKSMKILPAPAEVGT